MPSFAASYYGLPDIGFIAWPDMVAFVQRLRGAFPHHHLPEAPRAGCRRWTPRAGSA